MNRLMLGILLFVWTVGSLGLIAPGETPDVAQALTRDEGPMEEPPQSQPVDDWSPKEPGKNLVFERISREKNLSQSSVTSILQDRQGFIWLATQEGLNRYDGYSFRTFTPDQLDENSLSYPSLLSLAEDQQGKIWIATEMAGVDRYDPQTKRFAHYRYKVAAPWTLSSDAAQTVLADRTGTVWVGTRDGLNRFNAETDQFLRFFHDEKDAGSLAHNIVHSLFEDRGGTLWVGTGNGLSRYDRANNQFKSYIPPFLAVEQEKNIPILHIYQDRSGFLWLGTTMGLYRFDPDTETFVRYRHSATDPTTLSHDEVSSILEDSLGVLWIGTRGGGLNWLNRTTGQFSAYHYSSNSLNSLSDDTVLTLYEDSSHVLWVGTQGGGVNKVVRLPKRFGHIQVEAGANGADSLKYNKVLSIYEDAQERLWLSSSGGLARYDYRTQTWEIVAAPGENQAWTDRKSISVIRGDAKGGLWLGTSQWGLNYFHPDRQELVHYPFSDGSPYSSSSATIASLLVDSDETIWVGSRDGSLDRLDPTTGVFTRYITPKTVRGDPMEFQPIWSILKDQKGFIWVGTGGSGLIQIDPESKQTKKYLPVPSGLPSPSSNSVLCVFQDSAGTFWAGTQGGLSRLDLSTGTFKHYRQKDGLPNDIIYGILEDDQGYLWLSTNKGLSRFNQQSEVFVNFDVDDGLQSLEFNLGSYFQSPRGELYFGGINGVNVFNSRRMENGNTFIPQIVLTSLTQGGEPASPESPVESAKEFTFYWPKNFFEFEFVSLNFAHSEKNQYAYWLENFDRTWNYQESNRFGRYTNLPGGTYILHLKGSNNDGIWNSVGANIKITIVPPFWQTLSFQIVALLLVLAGIFGVYRYQAFSAARHADELRSLVDERTRDLRQRSLQLEEKTRQVERRADQFRAISEVGHHMTSLVGVDQLLEGILLTIKDTFDYYLVGIGILEENELVMRALVGEDWAERGIQLLRLPNSDRGVMNWVAQTGEIFVIPDVSAEARYVRWPADSEARSELAVPLRAQSGIIGVLNVESKAPNGFDEVDFQVLQSLANQAAVAVENSRLYEKAREAAVLQERNRLARELHDAVTQTLFSASLISEALPASWEKSPAEGKRLLGDLRQLSRGALAEMRTLLLELRPAALVEVKLDALLHQLAEAAEGREGIPVVVNVEGESCLPTDVHISLYRIAQEALNNALKHARAEKIQIYLRFLEPDADDPEERRGVLLSIQDDGRGFDPANIPPNHLGLGIMRERAQSIGADLTIESQIQGQIQNQIGRKDESHGTQITVLWEEPADDSADSRSGLGG